MIKPTIILTGLAIVIAGCSALARGDASPSQAEQPVVEEPTAPVAEPAPLVDATEPPAEVVPDPTGDESQTEPASSAAQAVVPVDLPEPQNQLGEGQYSWNQLLSRDAIAPIYNPEFTGAGNAPYAADELVIGVEINGEAKAYAIGPLNGREMVNDTIGGRPILVTW